MLPNKPTAINCHQTSTSSTIYTPIPRDYFPLRSLDVGPWSLRVLPDHYYTLRTGATLSAKSPSSRRASRISGRGTAAGQVESTSPDVHANWYHKDPEARVRIVLTVEEGATGEPLALTGNSRSRCYTHFQKMLGANLSAWHKKFIPIHICLLSLCRRYHRTPFSVIESSRAAK